MSAGQVTIYISADSPTDYISILEAYGEVLYEDSKIYEDVISLASVVMDKMELTIEELRSMYLTCFVALEYILFKIFDTVIVIKRFTLYTPLNRGRGPPQNQCRGLKCRKYKRVLAKEIFSSSRHCFKKIIWKTFQHIIS